MGFLSKLFGSGSDPSSHPQLKDFMIVVADASPTIQKVIELTFQPTGATVRSFSDSEALSIFLQDNHPHVAIIDSSLTPRSGFDIAFYIKSHDRLKGIPVFLLVPSLQGYDTERYRCSMANAVIAKPFDSRMLLTTVAEALKSNEGV